MAYNTENDEYDDGDLVERCLDGDQSCWEKLVKKHYRVIVSVIRSPQWGFVRDEKEDLIQETLEEIVKSLPNYRHQHKLPGYIRSIAFRQCTESLKRKLALKRAGDLDCDHVDTIGAERDNPGAHIPANPGPDPLGALMAKERVGILKRGLERLGDECRKLIRMRFFEDWSFPEMAESLGLKENTVAVKVGRCVQKLKPFFNSLL
jgi:RNA polymerase sigma-70 factor, ECF subfamily